MLNFAKKLKKLRIDKNLTQEELAEYLGLSGKSAISNWEKGSSRPDKIEHYEKLSKLFHISLDSLIKDEPLTSIVRENNIRYVAEDEIIRGEIYKPQYPLLGKVPAGRSEVYISDWVEMEVIDFDPQDHALLMIDEEYGYSMTPIMQPGDVIMISLKENKFESGDIVAARWDDTKGAIKILSINEDDKAWIALHSSNSAEAPIFIKRNKVKLFRVVAWFDRKKVRKML